MAKKFDVAVQTYNNLENYSNCINCNNTIINPLCPHCLTKGFIEWAKAYPDIEKETVSKVKHFIKKSIKDTGEDCAICGKKVHTCVYCFTDFLYSLVKETGPGPEILSEFLFIFNFDMKRIGYVHELEALGGY
jgi:hypothetical protein